MAINLRPGFLTSCVTAYIQTHVQHLTQSILSHVNAQQLSNVDASLLESEIGQLIETGRNEANHIVVTHSCMSIQAKKVIGIVGLIIGILASMSAATATIAGFTIAPWAIATAAILGVIMAVACGVLLRDAQHQEQLVQALCLPLNMLARNIHMAATTPPQAAPVAVPAAAQPLVAPATAPVIQPLAPVAVAPAAPPSAPQPAPPPAPVPRASRTRAARRAPPPPITIAQRTVTPPPSKPSLPSGPGSVSYAFGIPSPPPVAAAARQSPPSTIGQAFQDYQKANQKMKMTASLSHRSQIQVSATTSPLPFVRATASPQSGAGSPPPWVKGVLSDIQTPSPKSGQPARLSPHWLAGSRTSSPPKSPEAPHNRRAPSMSYIPGSGISGVDI